MYNTLSGDTEATASWISLDFATMLSANLSISEADKIIRTFDPGTTENLTNKREKKKQ